MIHFQNIFYESTNRVIQSVTLSAVDQQERGGNNLTNTRIDSSLRFSEHTLSFDSSSSFNCL